MLKNWYILYTKEKSEKKVSALLSTKKIKSFCPVQYRQIKHFNRVKLVNQVLFSRYVFAYMDETEIDLCKQLNHVVNFVYWNSERAIIKNEEIDEIRNFTTNYQNIRLQRSIVNVNSQPSFINPPSYSLRGNLVMIKNKFIKVDLPSLGCMMVAVMDGDGVIGVRGNQTFFNSNFRQSSTNIKNPSLS